MEPTKIIGAVCQPKEFDENLKIDFSGFVKSKGGVSYLPWAEIVRTLHKAVPNCTYGFKEAPDGSLVHYTPDKGAYFRPYLTRYWVNVEGEIVVVIETPPGFFPVSNMGSRHKALVSPDIRAIDNTLRRAVAKEIGVMTGIGLQLWAHEDPYDLVDDEDEPAPSSAGVAALMRSGLKTASTPAPSANGAVSGSTDALDKAGDASGLTEHGKKTIAVALRAESWSQIPADKSPKIIQLLADPDNVKLFNAGKNSSGKTINPKSPEEETKELVAAFNQSQEKATS